MAQTGILLLIVIFAFIHQDTDALACCRGYSKRELPFNLIRGYSIQTIKRTCNIDAVIFHTSTGRHVCANPAQPWVMNSIWRLKEKVRTLKNKLKNISEDSPKAFPKR